MFILIALLIVWAGYGLYFMWTRDDEEVEKFWHAPFFFVVGMCIAALWVYELVVAAYQRAKELK